MAVIIPFYGVRGMAARAVGGFCCPAPPEPRLPKLVKQREPTHCHWHL